MWISRLFRLDSRAQQNAKKPHVFLSENSSFQRLASLPAYSLSALRNGTLYPDGGR
jgi:hypothetical protein